MGLEFILFISAILLGIFVYWRESKSNTIYRFFNKLFNSEALQMKPSNKKGFVFKQAFLPRLVYVASAFLFFSVILQFLTPFKIFSSYNGLSLFASSIVGTLIGTYLANVVFKSSEVIDEKGDSIVDAVKDTVEKGKEFIKDLEAKEIEPEVETNQDIKEEKPTSENKKSARERLKDKGYM